jgi:hypothetical protein
MLSYRFVTDLANFAGQEGVCAQLDGDVRHVVGVDVGASVKSAVSLHQGVRSRAYPCKTIKINLQLFLIWLTRSHALGLSLYRSLRIFNRLSHVRGPT